jgi:hypothetical protein
VKYIRSSAGLFMNMSNVRLFIGNRASKINFLLALNICLCCRARIRLRLDSTLFIKSSLLMFSSLIDKLFVIIYNATLLWLAYFEAAEYTKFKWKWKIS